MSLGMNSHMRPVAEGGVEPVAPATCPEGANPYLAQPEKGLALISSLVAVGGLASQRHRCLEEYRTLVENEFLALAERDYNTTGASAYRKLLRIGHDLEELTQFPQIEQRFTVAVGGMFSAGKSRFLNALLGAELLPTDTVPTTSIPTYITAGDKDSIEVLNRYQERVVVDEEALQAICHAFHERYDVSFSHVLRLVHVQRKALPYSTTFLDTPGYSKSDSLDRRENVDEVIAREHLRRADYLIWLVDIQNGTIPRDDLLFIRSLDLEQPILFILNKADKKCPEEVAQTLQAARRDLAREKDIRVYGVTAYSAARGQEFGDQPCLHRFLNEVSQEKAGSPVLQRAERVFEEYQAFYESEKIRLRQQRGVLNETALSPDIDQALRQKATAMAEGSRKRIVDLELAERDLARLRRELRKLIETIASESGLALADPAAPRLVGPGLTAPEEAEAYRFQGFLDSVSPEVDATFLRKSAVDTLPARVIKMDSTCIYFEAEAGLKAMVLLGEVRKLTGLGREEVAALLPAGREVSLHLREKKRCLICYPPASQPGGQDQ